MHLGAALERARTGSALVAPLCLDALTARIAHQAGFQFGYLSGGALGYAHAVSEALLTLTEVADAARHITQRSDIGLIVDAGIGFGDAVHMARTVSELEAAGAVGIEIEDQVAPKRVSHHRGIEHLVPLDEMVGRIEQAVAARRDPGFLIIARTGAVANESLDAAIERLAAYRGAGANVLMLMTDTDGFRQAHAALDAPLATITSMDARPPEQWAELGVCLVIDPFTAQVLSVQAVRAAYGKFVAEGHSGADRKAIFEAYRELPTIAGLDAYYAIEDVTTERK